MSLWISWDERMVEWWLRGDGVRLLVIGEVCLLYKL